MKLKLRIVLFNLVNVFVPILISFISILIYFFIQTNIFSNTASIKEISNKADIEQSFFETSKEIKKNEKELLKRDFQNNLISQIKDRDFNIIAFKDEVLFFSSIKELSLIDMEFIKNSDRYGDLNEKRFLKKKIDINFSDDTIGELILLKEVKNKTFNFKYFIVTILIVFIITFILTNLVLARFYTKNVIQPIESLVASTKDISFGNLDNEIIEQGDEEIASLFVNFERMRLKLKEYVTNQLKMDDNRKIMITSISHDLKTPLTSIKGYIQGILDGIAVSPEKKEKYLKNVLGKTEIMNKMIDDLFLYSKLDLKQLVFNIENVNILDYFKYCIDEIKPELERINIKLSFENKIKDNIIVRMDKEKFQRVLMNIIDNSMKYINKIEGKIDIFTRETKNTIVIEIKDNGMGIVDDEIKLIFERFYRSDIARGKTSGSGLGLSIAKQILNAFDGDIWAKSELNIGTSIMISLMKGISKDGNEKKYISS
ncbi:MAG: HAMP domain-containing sensor histidine kinase [Clostridiales bacterium]